MSKDNSDQLSGRNENENSQRRESRLRRAVKWVGGTSLIAGLTMLYVDAIPAYLQSERLTKLGVAGMAIASLGAMACALSIEDQSEKRQFTASEQQLIDLADGLHGLHGPYAADANKVLADIQDGAISRGDGHRQLSEIAAANTDAVLMGLEAEQFISEWPGLS